MDISFSAQGDENESSASEVGSDNEKSMSFDQESDDDAHISETDEMQDEFLLDLFAAQNYDEHDTDMTPENQSFQSDNLYYSLDDLDSVFNRGDSKSKFYFYQDYLNKQISNEPLGGIRGVAWRATNRINCFDNDSMLSKDDAQLMFQMMDHALNNPGQQQQEFFSIVSDIMSRAAKPNTTKETFKECLNHEQKIMLDNFVSSLNPQQRDLYDKMGSALHFSEVKVPMNQSDANAMLLTGKWSIFQNIPIESVNIIDGHAVISLEGLLDHIVAQGVPILWKQSPDGIRNVDGINGCSAAQDIYQSFLSETPEPEQTAFAYLILWSDGFIRVYVKQKKNGVWILTVTLLDPNRKGISQFHTYCIAIGNSSQDHTAVINYFVDELKRIRQKKTRYSGVSNSFIDTSFRLLAYSSDRQERDSVVLTLNLGTFSQRFHYAAGIDPNTLPFCNDCFTQFCASLHQSSYPILPIERSDCQHCCGWNFESASVASRSISTPSNYPTIQSSNSPLAPKDRTVSETCVIAKEQDFDWMIQGLQFAFHNSTTEEYIPNSSPRRRARWSRDNIKAYLRTMGISGKVQDDLWRSVQVKRANPASETRQYIPPLWNQDIIHIKQFLNSPMHLIFHGIITDVMELSNMLFTKLQLLPSFERFANKYLLEIELLRLDWCKVRQLPKTQWLAENVLGLARIMPCIYGMFLTSTQMPASYSKSKLALQQTLNALHVMVSALMSPRCSSSDTQKLLFRFRSSRNIEMTCY